MCSQLLMFIFSMRMTLIADQPSNKRSPDYNSDLPTAATLTTSMTSCCIQVGLYFITKHMHLYYIYIKTIPRLHSKNV